VTESASGHKNLVPLIPQMFSLGTGGGGKNEGPEGELACPDSLRKLPVKWRWIVKACTGVDILSHSALALHQ